MMIFFYCSVSLADVTQELVYKVSQNGMDIGKRTVQITYLPTSKASPWGGKKIDFHTEIQPNIAGSIIQYQQRGVAQFSPDRSSFVVSNQIAQDLVEIQGRRTASGSWKVHSIHNGIAKKVEFSGTEVRDISIELFGMGSWLEDDPLDLLVVDGIDMYKINTVWKDNDKNSIPKNYIREAEQSIYFVEDNTTINAVTDRALNHTM